MTPRSRRPSRITRATTRSARTSPSRRPSATRARSCRGFPPSTYFGFAIRAARLLSQSLYRVRLVHANDPALEAIPEDATVIFVMNHRSNMDYVLVTWLVAERSALAYAVGEWARVWPLRSLVRAMGGYFIRRRHNNALYRKVLARYVQMATENGVTQAVFPEGGLSRTGHLGRPKLGPFLLHPRRLSARTIARRGLRARGDQLRPRDGGPQPARRPREGHPPLPVFRCVRSTATCVVSCGCG